MVENDSKKLPKVARSFCCVSCDYTTIKKSSYAKHLATDKHKNAENDSKLVDFDIKKLQKVAQFKCNCGKEYKYDSGYYRHKKICSYKQIEETQSDIKQLTTVILELVKQNGEFKEQLVQLAKQAGHNTTYTNSNNTNKFNINVFLKEKCKNALNMSDFVSQLNVSIKDLEETGRLGFSEGISKIFINGLQQLELYDRPLHCNDAKRETIYIKNGDEWTKDNEDKTILTKAIKEVAHKNIKQISEWQKIHSEYSDPDSKQNDKYLKIVSEAMSGSSEEESNKNYCKIIKNLVKESIIPGIEKE
jgi:hypothetical protein